MLRGSAKEERLIERRGARSQISDLVTDLRNSVADKDNSLKIEQVTTGAKLSGSRSKFKACRQTSRCSTNTSRVLRTSKPKLARRRKKQGNDVTAAVHKEYTL